jgi:hypothetical protein
MISSFEHAICARRIRFWQSERWAVLVLLAGLLVAICSQAHAQTIDALGAGSAVSGTDIFPAYQGANPATGVTAAQIGTYANGTTLSGSQNYTGLPSFNNVQGIKFAPSGGAPFELTSRGLSTPAVPVFYPTTANSPLAFDLSPNGNPTDAGYGKTWMDLCPQDIIVNGAGALTCMHLGSGTNQNFGVSEYNSGTMPNLNIGRLNGDTKVFTTSMTVRGTDGVLLLPIITTDATHTDSTLCQDTTTHGIYFGSGTAGVCLGTSSARFKHNIADLSAGLDQIMKLRTVSYAYNADHGDPSHTLYGFTAEDMAKSLPKLVGTDSEGMPNSVDYLGVVPVLVKAVQEHQAEIDRLKSRWCLGKVCW